jgi:type II secretory pathway predicted ATPase ExeA
VLNSLNLQADSRADYVTLFQQFQDFVITEYAEGRHVALIIDEAQNLRADTLEELRMLTNINSNKDELLQIILLGQPELHDLIRRPEMRQFAQRVTATYHLEPMNLPTTRDYIRHRLIHAGGTGDEVSLEAIQYVFAEAGGIPRMVNKLCDLAMVYAASAGRDQVDVATVKELIADGLILKPRQLPLFLTNRVDIRGEAAE